MVVRNYCGLVRDSCRGELKLDSYMLGHGDGCSTGECSWAEDGEAGVGWAVVRDCWVAIGDCLAAVGDCWAAGSVGCCWCGKGSVFPIVGLVRVGFGTVGCKSKASSKKLYAEVVLGQGNDTLYEKRQILNK
ncbi:hypothetical protein Tco_0390298 [Tanacetum coccineum]